MGIIELLLIILLIVFLCGGGVGYSRRADWGYAPGGIFGLLLLIILIIILVRLI